MKTETNETKPDRILEKIQALLAKAEATRFPAEAKAFSAKAQELMSRWSIDEAMLAGQGPKAEIVQREVEIYANAYSGRKQSLLSAIVRANHCKHIQVGSSLSQNKVCRRVLVVGYSQDCEFVVRLFLSLVLQLKQELMRPDVRMQMQHDCSRPGEHVRWRNSFAFAYADAIDDRLEKAKRRAETQAKKKYGGKSMAVVLAARTAEVARRFNELYPHAVNGRRSKACGDFDSACELGRLAADRADLGAPKIERRKLLMAPAQRRN
jgi:hypothetical protein